MSGAGIFVPLAVSAGQRQNSREKSILTPIWKSNSTNLRFSAILSVIVMSWSVRSMIRILFLCHGNICRSPMAEFIMKDLVKKAGLEQSIQIESAATSTEEIGNPVHPGTAAVLREHGIGGFEGKRARQLRRADYDAFDFIIGMDTANIRNMNWILGGDPDGKVLKLLEFAGTNRSVDDPWYTGDFETTYADVCDGCEGLLAYLGV